MGGDSGAVGGGTGAVGGGTGGIAAEESSVAMATSPTSPARGQTFGESADADAGGPIAQGVSPGRLSKAREWTKTAVEPLSSQGVGACGGGACGSVEAQLQYAMMRDYLDGSTGGASEDEGEENGDEEELRRAIAQGRAKKVGPGGAGLGSIRENDPLVS